MEKLYIVKAENAGNLTINLTFSDNTTLISVAILTRNTTSILILASSAASPLITAMWCGAKTGI